MKSRFNLHGSIWRKMIFFLGMLFLLWNIILMWQIYSFPLTSAPASVDAAIVLGAAVWNGQPSPVFEERIKHSIFLFQSGQVEYLIFTGGFGKHDTIAESEAARAYAINEGVPSDNILIETNSHTTYENLYESCKLMRNANLQKAIIVSDPLHMKRAMRIALDIGIDAQPSPTPTTRYQTWRSKSGSLVYELFFYVLHLGAKAAGFVAECPG